MSRVTELEKALTTLFRKGTEIGYTETEIDEFLENIDYHAHPRYHLLSRYILYSHPESALLFPYPPAPPPPSVV